MRASWIVCALFLLLPACGPKPTPVAPAPLSATDERALGAGMVGVWKCTHTKVGNDGEKKEQPMDVTYSFQGDGTYHLSIHGGPFGMGMDKDYRFKLEGKNVTTDSPHGTYRIDALTPTSMELFHYEMTTTWYMKREGNPSAS